MSASARVLVGPSELELEELEDVLLSICVAITTSSDDEDDDDDDVR